MIASSAALSPSRPPVRRQRRSWALLLTLALSVMLSVPSPARAAERTPPSEAALDDDNLIALAGAVGLGFGGVCLMLGVAAAGVGSAMHETGADDLPTEVVLGLLIGGAVLAGVGVFSIGSSGALLAVDHVFFEE